MTVAAAVHVWLALRSKRTTWFLPGAPPAAVGTLAGNYLNDLKHLHLFDLVPHGGTSNTYDVDLVIEVLR